LERKGRLAYMVTLPPYLVGTDDSFHVSVLRKYITNLDLVVEYKALKI
jgi:hypothetical protein